jgi:outer membrane protein TolC
LPRPRALGSVRRRPDLYPSIAIAGSTGFASSTFEGARRPDLGNIFDGDSFAGFIGLQVNWPILNYGRVENNIRAQDAQYEQAVAAYRNTVLKAASDVEAGLSDFLRAKERSGFLAEAVDASKRSAELSLIQYRAGAVDFIRVNNAQTALVQQQDSLVVARARDRAGCGPDLPLARRRVGDPRGARIRRRGHFQAHA